MKTNVRQMFDEIAPTYDLLNHILSFGLDVWWRRKAIEYVRWKAGGRFLDIAAGTGDLSVAALRARPRHIVALDFAPQTLEIAQRKFLKLHGTRDSQCTFDIVAADAQVLPFKESSFDAVITAFGIRNFADQLQALRQMHRVLRIGGDVCILELSRPHLPLFAGIFRWYFHHVVPFIGGMLSGNRTAYQYLPESVDQFPASEEFLSMMDTAGFHNARHMPLTLGVATLYVGRK